MQPKCCASNFRAFAFSPERPIYARVSTFGQEPENQLQGPGQEARQAGSNGATGPRSGGQKPVREQGSSRTRRVPFDSQAVAQAGSTIPLGCALTLAPFTA
jgi:hypothetical protein